MHKGIGKYLLVMTVVSLSLGNVYAIAPGFYIGLMGGPATNSSSSLQVATSATGELPATGSVLANAKSTQFGNRFYLGYKMNQYAGFEGGFNFFSKIKYDTKGQQAISQPEFTVRDIDLMGRLSLPFKSVVDVFAEGGVALTYITESGSFPSNLNPLTGNYNNTNQTKVAPIVGVGATYDLNQSWMISASWIRLLAGGSVSNVDMYGLGISYHFTDKYCGQFLCDD